MNFFKYFFAATILFDIGVAMWVLYESKVSRRITRLYFLTFIFIILWETSMWVEFFVPTPRSLWNLVDQISFSLGSLLAFAIYFFKTLKRWSRLKPLISKRRIKGSHQTKYGDWIKTDSIVYTVRLNSIQAINFLKDKIIDLSKRFSTRRFITFLRNLNTMKTVLMQNIQPRLVFESFVLQL